MHNRVRPACIILIRQNSARGSKSAGKVFDRMSKGIREAPGKALIGDLAAESGDRTEGAFGKDSGLPTLALIFLTRPQFCLRDARHQALHVHILLHVHHQPFADTLKTQVSSKCILWVGLRATQPGSACSAIEAKQFQY